VRGVLNINKPAGMSSYDVLRKLKPVLKSKRLGHSGTLDPMATGVLLVLVNEATKISRLLLNLSKDYEAEIRFGLQTDTDDLTGKVTRTAPVPEIKAEELSRVLQEKFRGELLQVPPIFSALKQNGVPLYRRARQGQKPVRSARKVKVEDLSLLSWEPPIARIWCRVSAGTYIRALARDLGVALGSAATLAGLRRTRIGEFTLERSYSLSQVLGAEKGVEGLLVPVEQALAHLPKIVVSAEQAERLQKGRAVIFLEIEAKPGSELGLALTRESNFCALVKIKPGRLIPERIVYAE